ncbi:MAG: protein-disulfide reductase DsbD domain-containing protein, partial [Bdellovibrionota bacterium]
MFKAFFAASLFSIASVLIVPTQTAAQTIKQDHVEVRLISGANAANDSTKPLEIGVHFKIDSEWHVYWKNPGDSGAAPKFELTGAKLVEVNWPYPSRIPVAHLTNYGYDDEVVIFLSLAPESEEMKLNLEWLVCKIECIPGFGEFNFTRSTVSKDAATFGKFRARVPAASDDWLAKQISVDSAHLKFELEPLNSKIDQIKNVFVFPENGTFFQTSLPAVVPGDHSLSVSVPLTPNATVDSSTAPEKENFTFVIENKDGTTASFAKSISARKEPTSWLMGLLLAVLGGFILNLMPCVFPVLFLKAFGFLKESDPRAIRRSSWAYSIGVVISFLAFGGLLTGLRFAGEAIGWGYQLQNPWLVYLLALLFFSMALSFYGYFEFGDSLAGRAGSLGSHRLFNGSFGTGVLAVVVASPCTAPFMGTALGLTLLLPIYQSLAIFAALGIGMAAPMLLLGYAPGLIKKLPRSGAWMITVKQLLSFPLFATSLWLLWVLEKQKGADAVFISLLSFLLVCVAIWLLQENRNRIAKIFG